MNTTSVKKENILQPTLLPEHFDKIKLLYKYFLDANVIFHTDKNNHTTMIIPQHRSQLYWLDVITGDLAPKIYDIFEFNNFGLPKRLLKSFFKKWLIDEKHPVDILFDDYNKWMLNINSGSRVLNIPNHLK